MAGSDQDAADTFDYVIVGAGSAGCVLANRLTEDASCRVLLLEAGPPASSPLIKVPLGVTFLFEHKRLNWRFHATPQRFAGGREIYVPRGKTLGGSSAINGMVYTRGHPHDYDDWAEAGNPGWSYREVLPYFRRSENNENWTASPFHGTGGPLNVKHFEEHNPLAEVLFEAAASLGYGRCPDFSGADHEGFGYRQATVRDGRRVTAATAFLDPVRGRENLTILTDAQASRVLLEARRAVGVEAEVGGTMRSFRARREVVLAAGVFGSPVLLNLSGIGDAADLGRHGIPVAHHLPGVGRNLQEHCSAPIQYSTPTTVTYGISLRTIPRNAWSLVEYALFRRGLLANNMLHAGGFVKTDPGLDRPDVQFILMPVNRDARGRMGIGHGYGLITIVLRPKSRGSVTLRSRNFRDDPLIDLGFFADPRDLDLLTRGMKEARRLLEAPAFAPYRGDETRPGPAVDSDEGLKAYARENAVTVFHAAGTCRMGPAGDPGAVVDAELRVRGIDGLRVADASIMPTVIGGNTNAPAIMIGEKAADMILRRPALPAAGDLPGRPARRALA